MARLRQRPGNLVGVGTLVRPLRQLRNSKIEHLYIAIVTHHHVLGLDIAMHDARLVRDRQRRRDLHCNAERLVQRHSASPIQHLPQGLAIRRISVAMN